MNKVPKLGFEISMSLEEGRGPEWESEFFNRFLTEAIVENGLSFEGSSDSGVVFAPDGNTTESHRKAVHDWLGTKRIEYVDIGKLIIL